MQKILEEMKKKVNLNLLKQCFLYTYIWGFAAHGYCFLNMLVCHDSLNSFSIASQWPKARLGRIFYVFYIEFTRGRIVLPWVIGLLTLLWIALAVYVIVRIFDIENKWLLILIAGICVTNPSVYTIAATYLHDLDADAFAILLSVLSVFLWKKAVKESKTGRKCLFLFAASVLLSITLGIYQSYLSIAITLIIFVCIKELWEKEESLLVLRRGLSAVGMIGVAAVCYFAELKVSERFSGVESFNTNDYNSLGNMSGLFSENIFEKVWNTYVDFFETVKGVMLISDPEKLYILIFGLIMISILVLSLICLKKMDWLGRVLFCLLCAVMPFGMNITYFLSDGNSHILTQYAIWLLFMLALLMVKWFYDHSHCRINFRKNLMLLIGVCVFLINMENVQAANTIYVKKNLEATSTLSYMTRVADAMEEQEEYIPGETPVAFIGENVIGQERRGFQKYEILMGVGYRSPITYESTYGKYFMFMLGRPMVSADASEFENREEVLEMPAFPKEGSIAMIDGTLVVKLQ